MKIANLLTGSAALALISVTAYAAAGDVTGTVNVYGHVDAACTVINGQSTSSSFSGSIDMGNLAGVDGKINSALTGAYDTKSQSFYVVCNTATPGISLQATSMAAAATPPDASYTNSVGYRARLKLSEVGSNTETFSATSGAGSPTTGSLAHALTASGSNNVQVLVDTLTTNGGVLVAGNYGVGNPNGTGGVISITISPGS